MVRVWKNVAIYLILSVLTVVFLFPVIWMVSSSFKDDTQIFRDLDTIRALVPGMPQSGNLFQNYADALNRVPLLLYAWNSFFYVTVLVVLSLLVNSMAAYAFARLRFPLRDFWFAVVVACIIIPIESIFLPLFLIVHELGWVNTYQGLIVPFVANAFNIFMFRQFFLGLPAELEEAAKIDGASTWRIFFQIVVPLSKPVFATVAVITFVTYWNDFLWPLMIVTDESMRTVQVGLNTFFNEQPVYYGQVMAALTMMTIPMVLVFLFFQKYYVKGLTHTGMKN